MPSTSYCERYEGQLGIVRMPKDIPKESPIPGTNKSRHAYEKKVVMVLPMALLSKELYTE